MQALTTSPDLTTALDFASVSPKKSYRSLQPGWLEKKTVWFLIRLQIFWIACRVLKSPRKILKTFRSLLTLRNTVNGGNLDKIYRVNGRYYYNQYTPGWPSVAYKELIKSELKRHVDPLHAPERLSFVFFAITRKCPMHCEHCFEWENLNQKETFTKEELKKVVDLYQQEGCLQFHFSGGEPMTRIKDLPELMRHSSKKSECWVLSSGFNVTNENARQLKEAGCRGMVVSIDHYIPELHNIFRGHQQSFENAVKAVQYIREAGMVSSISVCVTKSFIEAGHLMKYLEFAAGLGVHFVQVLEPKDVGNYSNKDVLLANRHIDELDRIFKLVNYHPDYRHYPTVLYHGYHQRRVGCFSGSRSVYIDAAGDVHACPFCHTKSYNIKQVINSGSASIPVKENKCPRYESIA